MAHTYGTRKTNPILWHKLARQNLINLKTLISKIEEKVPLQNGGYDLIGETQDDAIHLAKENRELFSDYELNSDAGPIKDDPAISCLLSGTRTSPVLRTDLKNLGCKTFSILELLGPDEDSTKGEQPKLSTPDNFIQLGQPEESGLRMNKSAEISLVQDFVAKLKSLESRRKSGYIDEAEARGKLQDVMDKMASHHKLLTTLEVEYCISTEAEWFLDIIKKYVVDRNKKESILKINGLIAHLTGHENQYSPYISNFIEQLEKWVERLKSEPSSSAAVTTGDDPVTLIDASKFNEGKTFNLLKRIIEDTTRKGVILEEKETERTFRSLKKNLKDKGYVPLADSIEWNKGKPKTRIPFGQITILPQKTKK
jgi:hypothetical protein